MQAIRIEESIKGCGKDEANEAMHNIKPKYNFLKFLIGYIEIFYLCDEELSMFPNAKLKLDMNL